MKAKSKAQRLPTFREWLEKYEPHEFRLVIRPKQGALKGWTCGIEQVGHLMGMRKTIFSSPKRPCAQQDGLGRTPNDALRYFILLIRGKLIGPSVSDPRQRIRVPRHFRAA